MCVRVDWLVGAGGTRSAVSLCIDFYSLGHNLLSFRQVCPFGGILPAKVDSPASCVSLSWDIPLLLALCFVLNVRLVFVCLFGAICFLEFFVKFVSCGSCVFALCVCVCVCM